ncbi:hypothetical protein E3N88_28421 [Mikania micrantha]|uniref:Uncharacterized protein n=1 Tax=Mikania micrantha TaxID=192012 RepID=A0A5N6N0L4_9ASTR|nr:hypothetical protein E3N88_28421 [Mikania micrantha]
MCRASEDVRLNQNPQMRVPTEGLDRNRDGDDRMTWWPKEGWPANGKVIGECWVANEGLPKGLAANEAALAE